MGEGSFFEKQIDVAPVQEKILWVVRARMHFEYDCAIEVHLVCHSDVEL
jgi:hypothetical protein